MAKNSRRVSMNVKVSPKTKAWVNRQVDRGGYRDASDFVETVLDRESRVPTLRSWDDVPSLLAEAVASGPERPLTSRDWARLRRAATVGLTRRKAVDRRRERAA